MKAIAIKEALPSTDEDCFIEIEVETPVPSKQELLVRISAVSVNPVDTKVRRAFDGANGHRILGWDAVGEVISVGDEVVEFKPGDRVYYAGDITKPGSNSEYQIVDHRIVAKAPVSISDAESAAIPLTALTAWEALFRRMGITNQSKGTILIIGGAGGVGSLAIQLAKKLTQLTIIATASRPDSQAHCQALGASHVVNWKNLTENVEATGFNQVDFILNCSDMDSHWGAMGHLIKPQGTICSIVENQMPLDMATLKTKSATLVWEFMFTRSMFTTEDMVEQGQILQSVAKLIDDGTLKTTLSNQLHGLNCENFRKVHQQLESGKTIGKWVITF